MLCLRAIGNPTNVCIRAKCYKRIDACSKCMMKLLTRYLVVKISILFLKRLHAHVVTCWADLAYNGKNHKILFWTSTHAPSFVCHEKPMA